VSPMQWRMIGRRGEFASWTVVGDPAQAAWPDQAEANRAMTEAVGKRRRDFELTTNYRNAAEIFEVAARVIRRAEPGISLPTAVRRAGVPPRHETVRDLRPAVQAAVREILADVEGTVGVIATSVTRDEVAGWLTEVAEPRLQVVTGLDAKGMEYDGVVVVEPGALAAEGANGVRTLYVALSRATQRLTTVATSPAWLPPAA
jgi:DNA helicase IV